MVDPATLRRHIAQVAVRQWGHVTRAQLLGLGMAPSTIGQWIRVGKLLPAHAGVYAVGYRRVEPVSRAMAAVLACGEGTALSHDSALALWNLRRWPAEAEVIAPTRVRRPGIAVHRSTTLTATDTTVELGVPTTRAARAIRDMGGRLTPRQRTRLANDARLRRIATDDEFERLVGHRRNPTRSGLEDEAQRWYEANDLPQPITNARIGDQEVDAYYPRQRVILEFDDYATHGDPIRFAADRERDADHLAQGIRTVRVLRGRLTAAEARRLRTILDDLS